MVKCIFFAVEVGYYNSLGKQIVNKQKTSPSGDVCCQMTLLCYYAMSSCFKGQPQCWDNIC